MSLLAALAATLATLLARPSLVALWQGYQLARAGGALLASVLLAWLVPQRAALASVETALALYALATAPVLAALGQAYVRAVGAAAGAGPQALVGRRYARVGAALLAASAGVVLGVGLLVAPSPQWALVGGVVAALLGPLLLGPLLELQALAQGRRGWLVGLALVQGLGLPAVAVAGALAARGPQPALGVGLALGLWASLGVGLRLAWRAAQPPPADNSPAPPVAWPALGALLLVALAGTGADALDALLVRLTLPAEAFLAFRYGARELPLTLVLATAASTALAHRVAQAAAGPDGLAAALAELRRHHRRLMAVGFGAAAVLLLLSDALFALAYPAAYAGAAAVFDLYLLLAISRVLLPLAVLLGLGHTRPLLWAAGAELALHVGLSLLLLPHLGLWAPACAAVVAYTAEKAALLYALSRRGVPPQAVIDVPRWALGSLALLLLLALKHGALRAL